ncbi:MAG: leucine-rich repeat protein [Oscillospiraceae bacterium]|nr:leucine-rich repeat protein [Oscillospiraceae bacterium]
MKLGKTLSILSAALLGLSAAAVPVTLSDAPGSIVAEAAVSGDWQYTVSSGKATITGYTGTATSITIPGTLGGKTVVAIGSEAFMSNQKLTSVTVPASVTVIRDFAFNSCSKLNTVEVKGSAHIEELAFGYCTALTNAKLHQNCTSDEGAFNDCTALTKLKGVSAWNYSVGGPVLNSSSDIRKLIRNNFTKSKNVKFVDDYITALCNYVVARETRSWMSEAAKARQLFLWLCDNCHFETDNTTFHNAENQLYSSVFLSYGLDGEGESVCSGYSKAYKMLLSAAGIEAYLVRSDLNDYGLSQVDLEYWGTGGHMWNLIKVDGKYYECDASNGDNDPARRYQYFLQTDFEMFSMHNNYYNSTKVTGAGLESHPYLSATLSTGRTGLSQCVYSYSDANYDGLLDSDWDFNGTANWDDYLIYSKICAACNVPYISIDNQQDFLNNLVIWNMSPAEWAQSF